MAKKNQAAAAATQAPAQEAPASAQQQEADTSKDVQLSNGQTETLGTLPTVSAKIRYLHDEGFSKSQIAKALGKRYQHVRNVLITPVSNPTGAQTQAPQSAPAENTEAKK